MPVRRGTTAVSFRVGSTAVAAMWRGAEYYSVDNDAAAYIAAVEAADAQKLEPAVARAINDFVVGCKADGIWSAIKASCILMGARTLSGALAPLAGTAPTNVNFIAADYNRKTGLVGNGSTKYLDSNRAGNADPQNNFHASVYGSALQGGNGSPPFAVWAGLTGSSGGTFFRTLQLFWPGPALGYFFSARDGDTPNQWITTLASSGFVGVSRSSSNSSTGRAKGSSQSFTRTSFSSLSGNIYLFASNDSPAALHTNSRLAFYSIGEAIDLALLDTRVSALYTAIGAAIP